jgi:hypothetical protein
MSLMLRLLARWPTALALRVASVMGLLALAIICWAVLDPMPIPLVASMSVSPLFGGGAFLLFGVSIAADLAQARMHHLPRGSGAP